MRLDVTLQIKNPRFSLQDLQGFTSSALPVEVTGMPDDFGAAGEVAVVRIELVTPDGLRLSAVGDRRGASYYALFAADNFPTYGIVRKGVKIYATLVQGGASHEMLVAVGDLDISAAAAEAVPGDSAAAYVQKGDKLYLQTTLDEYGVQHYTLQRMVYDDDIGWGAEWVGDYILNGNEFVEVPPMEG